MPAHLLIGTTSGSDQAKTLVISVSWPMRPHTFCSSVARPKAMTLESNASRQVGTHRPRWDPHPRRLPQRRALTLCPRPSHSHRGLRLSFTPDTHSRPMLLNCATSCFE